MKGIQLAFALIFVVNLAFTQETFVKKFDTSGVVFSGYWKPVKASEPTSQLQLCIRVENQSAEPAEVKFNVSFFDTGLELESSPQFKLCVSPGKKLEGRKYGLCLISEELTNEQIKSDSFDWSVVDVEVHKANDCK